MNKGWPTRWKLLYYILLNTLPTLIRRFSGATDYLFWCVGCNDRGSVCYFMYLVVSAIPILCVVCGLVWVCFCKRVVPCGSWTFCVWYVLVFYASVLMTIGMICTYLTWGVLVLCSRNIRLKSGMYSSCL